MKWVKLLVELVGHIAWPVAILTILLIFRKSIMYKLRWLTKATKGDASLEFATSQRENMFEKERKLSDITEDSLTWDDYLDALEQWAVWIAAGALYVRQLYRPGLLRKKDVNLFNQGMKSFEVLFKKLQENRPESDGFKKLMKAKDDLIPYDIAENDLSWFENL